LQLKHAVASKKEDGEGVIISENIGPFSELKLFGNIYTGEP
jgi:hypothetical protein